MISHWASSSFSLTKSSSWVLLGKCTAYGSVSFVHLGEYAIEMLKDDDHKYQIAATLGLGGGVLFMAGL